MLYTPSPGGWGIVFWNTPGDPGAGDFRTQNTPGSPGARGGGYFLDPGYGISKHIEQNTYIEEPFNAWCWRSWLNDTFEVDIVSFLDTVWFKDSAKLQRNDGQICKIKNIRSTIYMKEALFRYLFNGNYQQKTSINGLRTVSIEKWYWPFFIETILFFKNHPTRARKEKDNFIKRYSL